MIGIESISSYVPSSSIDNIQQGKGFGEDEAFIRGKIGALTLPIANDIESAAYMAGEAINRLCQKTNICHREIDVIALVTQNPDHSGIPHTSGLLHGALGLNEHTACFDIGLGCSGYVYGLSILQAFMKEMGYKRGVLVTSDQYSRIINRNDRVTSLLFGDAATATLLSESGTWGISKPLLATSGKMGSALMKKNGALHMHGRQVFDFASREVPKQLRDYLQVNCLSLEEIDAVCLHQGSAAIVKSIAKRFPGNEDKFINGLERFGNTVSSSIPLLLEQHVLDTDYENVLISGFGVGLSWGTNLLSRLH